MKTFTKLLLCLSITLSLLQHSAAQSGKNEDLLQLQIDVSYLADDQLEGRETGTIGEGLAAGYIAGRFIEMHISPKGDSTFYFQQFGRKPEYNPHAHRQADTSKVITGRNVVGYIDNGAKTTVVIGAHYDHLGWGAEGSLFEGDSAIHNGADDNASGVASILLLAKNVKDKFKGHNYLIIAFSGEEKGLWGSNYFAHNPTIPIENIAYMLNLDMVGRLKPEKTIAVYGTGTSPLWNTILDFDNVDGIKSVRTESGIGSSDHTSFYLRNIPVLHFFTGQHADYHRPSDDIDKINFPGMLSVEKYIEYIIASLDGVEKPEFTKTKDEGTKKGTKYAVTLGVIPDYLYDGKGMRIDGVKGDRPAKKAGILAGDVVIKMGNLEISDMMKYMEALGKFKKGETISVTILREGKKKSFKVTF